MLSKKATPQGGGIERAPVKRPPDLFAIQRLDIQNPDDPGQRKDSINRKPSVNHQPVDAAPVFENTVFSTASRISKKQGNVHV
jgi:hypothetical protein